MNPELRSFKSPACRLLASACLLILVLSLSAPASATPDWQDRVLPLPKEMSVTATVTATADVIGLEIEAGQTDAPPLRRAQALLNDLARDAADDTTAPTVRIRLVDLKAQPDVLPEALRTRLRSVPNAAQAYAILSEAGPPACITLAADTPVGLLYAAQTLHQMILGGRDAPAPGETLLIPLPEILDWPDIEQRGFGLGGDLLDLHYPARWKLNFRNAYTKSRVSDEGELEHFALMGGRVNDRIAYLDETASLGFIIAPDINHLGIRWPNVSPPIDEQGHPRPGVSGYCWADAAVQAALSNDLEAAAASVEGYGSELTVWLTEHNVESCHCKTCAGENTYLIEARRVLEAFAHLRQRRPEFHLRLLLSQGSHRVEADILELMSSPLGENAGLIYYHGARTYLTDFKPMVPPTLEAFARAGGFLGIVPQISTHYSALLPASMPQFVRFRAAEYVEKQLASVRVFTPDHYFYPANIAALGEYCWNARGRSPEAFARAYATLTGINDPVDFARWVGLAGEAAWVLAEPQFFRKITHRPDGGPPEIQDQERFAAARRRAREALDLAIASKDPDRFVESVCTLAGLESIVRIQNIEALLADSPVEAQELQDELNALDRIAVSLYTAVHAWHDRAIARKRREFVKPVWGQPVYTQFFAEHGMKEWFMVSANALLRASDSYRQQARLQGIPEAGEGEFSAVELGKWTPDDFDDDGNLFKVFDLEDDVPRAGGAFGVAVDLIDGKDFHFGPVSIETRAADATEWKRVDENLQARASRRRITRKYGGPVSWHDFRFEIPPLETGVSRRLVLENSQRSGPAGREAVASTGVITLRTLPEPISDDSMNPDFWKAQALGNRAP